MLNQSVLGKRGVIRVHFKWVIPAVRCCEQPCIPHFRWRFASVMHSGMEADFEMSCKERLIMKICIPASFASTVHLAE